jgi:hypothetical protein
VILRQAAAAAGLTVEQLGQEVMRT